MKKAKKVLIILLIITTSIFMMGCDLFFSNQLGSTEFIRTPQNLLFVEQSDYDSSNDYPMVDMVFDAPATLGATKYTLQQYNSETEIWENFQYWGEDLETSESINDNFSINLNKDSKIRLLISGGDYDGQYSNEVYVELSNIDTYFQAYSLSNTISNYYDIYDDYSSGKLIATFTVKKNLPDNTVVENALDYQWFRVDPNDFENIIKIDGAISNEYTPTNDDKGYILMIKASGDNVNAGGYCQHLGPYIK